MRNATDTRGWWSLPTGPRNTIADVNGVRVGHHTACAGTARTGVSAILPHEGNLFEKPVPAAASILNGFGKSLGLVQLRELGEIETPILLSNTFAVPVCASALINRAIEENPSIGRKMATVNPLVLECNDGSVNDIQALHVSEDMAHEAIKNASAEFDQGTVGAGCGMKTFGFAGGVGSASRRVCLAGGGEYMLGAFVLSNFGQKSEMRVLGERIATPEPCKPDDEDKGSIIIVYATDAPLDSRQLERVCKRGGAALGRMGSFLGHQSGDIALAFSTANVFARNTSDVHTIQRLCESRLNGFFQAAVEAAEEAILNALWHAVPHESYDGTLLPALRAHYKGHMGR